MENKNYYPVKLDKKHGSAIVSDIDPMRTTYTNVDKQWELSYYGGHIIAESLPSKEVAQQFVDAYNEKYCDNPYRIIVPAEVVENGLSNTWNECLIVRIKDADHVASLATKKGYEYIGEKINDHYEFYAVSTARNTTIEDQIEFVDELKSGNKDLILAIKKNLIAIKRWNESPAIHNVDVEKVIEDLLNVIWSFVQTGSFNKTEKDNSVQNAEAALGMLRAFKQQREAKPNKEKHQQPLTLKETITDDLLTALHDKPEEVAKAIIEAIDQMINLRKP